MNEKEFSAPKEIGFIKNDYVHKKSFREEGILWCKDSLFLFGNFGSFFIQLSSKFVFSSNLLKIGKLLLILRFRVSHNLLCVLWFHQ